MGWETVQATAPLPISGQPLTSKTGHRRNHQSEGHLTGDFGLGWTPTFLSLTNFLCARKLPNGPPLFMCSPNIKIHQNFGNTLAERRHSPLPWWERPAVPSAPPGEGDLGGTRHLDSCLRRNDTSSPSIQLKCYHSLEEAGKNQTSLSVGE